MFIINFYLNMFRAPLCSKHVEIEVNNKHLIVASCWFFSLHTLLTMHGHRNLKLAQHLFLWHWLGYKLKINILTASIIPYLASLVAIQTIVENILQENGVKYRLNLKRMWFLSQSDIEYPCAKLFCRIYIFFPVLYLGLGGESMKYCRLIKANGHER